jgi:hypothetical protein
MEALLLTALRFNLTVVTPNEFLVRFAHLARADTKTTHLSQVTLVSLALSLFLEGQLHLFCKYSL